MVRPGPPVSVWGAAGKAGYVLSCVAAALVLAISGFSYFVVKNVDSIGGSHAITSGPSIGAQNILLMGLESRTDWNGNILPNDILNALHAGSRQGVENGVGGNATNTLILLHIPAGGKKAVGFSIPRDDWVNFADTLGTQQVGKVDQAYGVSLAAKEGQLRQQDPGMSQSQVAFEGNEAGRAATVATVELLTGVHIDHFAEVNLDGFYELAKDLGGVEVCLNHPVPLDPNSGFYAKKAGYQHLDAKLALAFVRQRDGLANGDLDRTHRQQAFLDSVMQQLRTQGVLSDFTKINSLLSTARQYVITDSGWNLLDFATQMRSLTSGNLTFRTLPIVAYETIDGQDANQVNPSYIQQIVNQTFYPPAASSSSSSSSRPPLPRRSPGPRPPPTPARPRWTSTTAATPRAWPGRSRPRWSRTGIRPDCSAIPPRWPRPRSSTVRARRRAPARSRVCSRYPRRRAPRWRRATCRSCSARTPRWPRSPARPRHRVRRLPSPLAALRAVPSTPRTASRASTEALAAYLR